MNEDAIKEELKEEIFFLNPKEEYDYFCKRVEVISKYNNEFFIYSSKYDLMKRYIRGLASVSDEYEASSLSDVYRDCLIELGLDDYCIDNEVNNYRLLHPNLNKNILISKRSR